MVWDQDEAWNADLLAQDKVQIVKDKDLFLAYTDGISDNIYVEGILKCLNEYMRSKQLIEEARDSAACVMRGSDRFRGDGLFGFSTPCADRFGHVTASFFAVHRMEITSS